MPRCRIFSTLMVCTLAAVAARAQQAATSLSLTTDTAVPTVRQLIHLSAALGGSIGPTGSIAFADNGTPIATVLLNPYGATILGIASLAQGAHNLTATYTGDSANSISTASLTLTVSGLPAPFGVSGATAYANSPLALTTLGLPADATGTVTFTDSATTLATSPITGVWTPNYLAYGDSITWGYGLPDSASNYVNRIAAGGGFSLANEALPGALACEILLFEVLPYGLGPAQASSPLSSLMAGTDDLDFHLGEPYEPLFRQCQQADLAWLAIPREYKIMAGDPGEGVLSGAWTFDPGNADLTTFGTLFNSAGSGTARYTITTAGAPIYLWYLISDRLPGSFTLAIDGAPTGTTYSTQPTPWLQSLMAADLDTGFTLLRLPAAAGVHTLDITLQSGTAGILAVGTPPSPGLASVHPTVLASDMVSQLTTSPPAPPALLAAYTQDIQSNIALLTADGLDLRFIPTEQFMHGTPGEMSDVVHPNVSGHAELAQAFQAVLANAATAPYATFSNTATTASATFANPGTHTVTAAYSGDRNYAAASATTTLTILPQTASSTTLATPATRVYFGATVTLTGSVSPANVTGTVTFYDGTQELAQLPVVAGAVVFSTARLPVGIHNLSAAYSGDAADMASASPMLQLEVEPAVTTLTLAPLWSTATYGPPTTLAAAILPASATGTVTFYDSGAVLGASTLAAGAASLSVTLGTGPHSVTAVYSGDASDQPTSSLAIATTILPISTTTTLGPAPASPAFGTLLTLTANVAPQSASGSVIFRDSAGGTLAQTALINGLATTSTNTLPLGGNTITAVYSGDTTHGPSNSPPITLQIVPAPTSTVLAAIPASLNAGSSMTLNAQVAPASATGTILFRDASLGVLGEAVVARGAASLTLSTPPVARYSITASYSGDDWNAASTSAAITSQVSLATTTITLSQPANALYSVPVAVSTHVTPATATGLVQFSEGSAILATATLANGNANAAFTNLPAGAHPIHANYLGDSGNASSTSESSTLTITPDPTTTTVTLAETAVPAGSPVIFNVAVSSGLSNTPSGAVGVRSGSTILATGPLANGSAGSAYATFSVPSSTLGPATVVASYFGDANDQASISASASYTVIATPTVASLSLSANQVPLQSTVSVVAMAAAANLIPSGSIVFTSNGSAFATVPLNAAGQASTTLVSPPLGTYAISATFVPNGLFAAASAEPQTLTVTLPLALTVTPATLSAAPGSIETATLTITPLSNFAGPIQARCQSPVAWLACSLTAPASLNGGVNVPVHLAIANSTAATSTAAIIFPLVTLTLGPLLLDCRRGRRRHRRRHRSLLAILLSLAALSVTACTSGGTFFNIPDGPQPLTLSVTAAGVTITAPLRVDITQ